MDSNHIMIILMTVLKYPNLNAFEISLKTNLSKEDIELGIQKINQILLENDFPQIDKCARSYSVPCYLRENQSEVFQLFQQNQIAFSQEERIYIIYLYLYCHPDYISSYHLQEIVQVSRNTTLSDLNELRRSIEAFNVDIQYSRSTGYMLTGNILSIHQAACYSISKLLNSQISSWIFEYLLSRFNTVNSMDKLMDFIEKHQNELSIQMIFGRLVLINYFAIFSLVRYQNTHFVIIDYEFPMVVDNDEFDDDFFAFIHSILLLIDEKIVGNLSKEELLFYNYLYAGAFLPNGTIQSTKIIMMTLDIVNEMEKISLINFINKEELTKGLARHFIPAMYRMKSGFIESEEMSKALIQTNQEIFELVKQSMVNSGYFVQDDLSDNEIAYIMAHFSGYLDMDEQQEQNLKALVVCPNGISSSLILKSELESIFGNLSFLNIHHLSEIDQLNDSDYNLIFSTVYFETKKPLYVVSLFMNHQEKIELYKLVTQQFNLQSPKTLLIENIYRTIQKYSTIHNEQALRDELSFYLNENNRYLRKEMPMLSDLIQTTTYQHSDEKLNWKEAIALAADPLIQNNSIDTNYVDAMVNKVEEYGAFIDLGKGVAIPHARPEDGVNKLGMSMLSLKETTYLLDDESHPIRLLICIAAIDNESHLKALSQLTNILMDDEQVKALIESDSFEEIEQILKGDK